MIYLAALKVDSKEARKFHFSAEGYATASEELGELIGGWVTYSYDGWDGKSYPNDGDEVSAVAAKVQIVGFKDVDVTKIGVEQTIRVVTTPFEGNGTIKKIMDVTSLIGMQIAIPIGFDEATFKVTLQALNNVEIAMDTPFEEGGYYIQKDDQNVAVSAKGTATYANGSTKEVIFKAPNKNNFNVFNALMGGATYYMRTQEEYFATYAYAGIEDTFKTNFLAPLEIKTSFRTKDSALAVPKNTKMFESGVATFYTGDIKFVVPDKETTKDVVIKPAVSDFDNIKFYDVDGVEVADVLKGENADRKYAKIGKFELCFTYRGVELKGWIDIQDIELESTYKISAKSKTFTISLDKAGNTDKDEQLGIKWKLLNSYVGDTVVKVGDVNINDYVININSAATEGVDIVISIIFDDVVLSSFQYIDFTLYNRTTSVEYNTINIYENKKTLGKGDIVVASLPAGDLTVDTNFAALIKLNWIDDDKTVSQIPLTYDASDQKWYFIVDADTKFEVSNYFMNANDTADKVGMSPTGTPTKGYAKAASLVLSYKLFPETTIEKRLTINKTIYSDGLLYLGTKTTLKKSELIDNAFMFAISDGEGGYQYVPVTYDAAADKYYFTFVDGQKIDAKITILRSDGTSVMDIVEGKPVFVGTGSSERCTVTVEVTYKETKLQISYKMYVYNK